MAFWLLYSGEFISAREAHDLKFVSGVFEPDELLGQAREMAETILQASPFSQQRIKTLVYEGLGIPVPGAWHSQVLSDRSRYPHLLRSPLQYDHRSAQLSHES